MARCNKGLKPIRDSMFSQQINTLTKAWSQTEIVHIPNKYHSDKRPFKDRKTFSQYTATKGGLIWRQELVPNRCTWNSLQTSLFSEASRRTKTIPCTRVHTSEGTSVRQSKWNISNANEKKLKDDGLPKVEFQNFSSLLRTTTNVFKSFSFFVFLLWSKNFRHFLATRFFLSADWKKCLAATWWLHWKS